MKLNRFFYLLKQGLTGAFSHGFRSFASVTITVACLLIMGAFSLLAVNVDANIKDLESESEILAFVDENLSEEDARSIEPAICAIDNVRDVSFITREEALENYKSQYDDSSLFEDIDSSVFRHRYVIYLDDITEMSATEGALRAVNGIADVNAYTELADGFVTVRNVVSIIAAIMILILFIVSLFIISNTIKLAAYTRRSEIAVMKMVGAADGFIRLPFIVEGIVLGLLGSAIAYFLEWGLYQVVCDKVMASIAGNLIGVMPFSAVSNPMLIAFLAVGTLVGAFGGGLAIRNYLKV